LWLYHDKSGNSIIDVTQYCPKCQSGLFDFRSDDFSPSLRLLLFILFIHGFFFFFFFLFDTISLYRFFLQMLLFFHTQIRV